jgi:hypothetical protein
MPISFKNKMVINNLKFFGILIFLNLFLLSFISATVCTNLPAIDERRIIPGNSTVNITLSLVGFTDKIGQTINLYIRERDGTSYDSIRTLSATIDDNGNANVVWVVTQADLDKTEECDYDQFYFVAEGVESGDLEIIDLTEVYWRNFKNSRYVGKCTDFPNITVSSLETTTIELVSFDPRIAEGTEVTFQVWEADNWNSDDFIATSNGTKGTSSVIGVWKVDFENMNTDDYDNFYFNLSAGAIKKTSHNLKLILVNPDCQDKTVCAQYQNKDDCESDLCSVEDGFGVVCGEITRNLTDGCYCYISCSCLWNEENGVCTSINSEMISAPNCGDPEDLPCGPGLGYCEFRLTGETGDCSTGFFSYNVEAFINWQDNNYSTKEEVPGLPEDAIQHGGWWHQNQSFVAICVNNSIILPCPASIALPFFEAFEFVIAVLIVILVYYFIFLRRKKKNKKNAGKIKSKKKSRIKRK